MGKNNLIPASKRSPEEVRRLGREGGIKSGEAKKKKKLLSQIYGDFLAKKYEVDINGEMETLTGQKFFEHIVTQILERSDSASVSMLKEIREATEGNKNTLSLDYEPVIKIRVIKGNNKSLATP